MAVIITHVDDIDYYEENREVPADETVLFSVDGEYYDLDLTAEHAAEFRELLKRYITVGKKCDTPPVKQAAPAASNGSKSRGLTPLQIARRRGKAMRAFADSRPDLGEISYLTPNNHICHSQRLKDEYEAYVEQHGEFKISAGSRWDNA